MEDVPDVYHRPYEAKYPAVCLDEASKQLITALRPDLPPKSGQIRRLVLRSEPTPPKQLRLRRPEVATSQSSKGFGV